MPAAYTRTIELTDCVTFDANAGIKVQPASQLSMKIFPQQRRRRGRHGMAWHGKRNGTAPMAVKIYNGHLLRETSTERTQSRKHNLHVTVSFI